MRLALNLMVIRGKVQTPLVLIALVLLLGIGCANFFSDMAPKDTDAIRLYEAKRLLDRSNWDGVLSKIAELSTAAQATREVQILRASAYAGRCGLEFISLIDNINRGTGGRLFQTLFAGFQNSTVAKASDCVTAEGILRDLWASSGTLSTDERLMLTFVSFAKIGATLNYFGDNESTSAADDGNNVLDPAFDACNNGHLPVASASELVVAVSLVYQNMVEIASAGVTLISSVKDQIDDVCSQAVNVCNVSYSSQATPTQRTAIRALTNENTAVGLGICAGDITTCIVGCAGN